MAEWVNASIDFGAPWVTFTLDLRDLDSLRLNQEFSNLRISSPSQMAKRAEEVITRLHPELAGGAVMGLRVNMLERRWEIQYTHPSLPRVFMGALPQVEPLKCALKDEAEPIVGALKESS